MLLLSASVAVGFVPPSSSALLRSWNPCFSTAVIYMGTLSCGTANCGSQTDCAKAYWENAEEDKLWHCICEGASTTDPTNPETHDCGIVAVVPGDQQPPYASCYTGDDCTTEETCSMVVTGSGYLSCTCIEIP